MFDSPANGVFFFVFLLAVPLAFALNIGVQRLYRRAIGNVMRQSSATAGHEFAVPAQRGVDNRTLTIAPIDAGNTVPFRVSLALRYFSAGLIYAVVATAVLFTLEDIAFTPRRFSIVAAVLAFPAIPFCLQVAGCKPVQVWLGIAAWAVLFAAIEPQALVLTVFYVGPAGVAAMLLANRAFRTTSLPLYLIALVLIIPPLFALDLALLLVPFLHSYALPAAGLVLLLIGVAASWFMAKLMARISRGASDLLLQSYAIWFILTLWQVTSLLGSVGVAAFWAVLPFVAYVGFFYLMSMVRKPNTESLLLFLRVFGQRKLQQDFTFGPMTNWRQDQPIMLIGAGDLATDTLDTDELAAFLSGATQRLFITSPADLARVLDRETSASADGLYPVLDYYCMADTWRPCVQTLMGRAAKVVLDLRGFQASNAGVQYEIGQLVRRVKMESLDVLVDKTTDVDLARKLFLQEWATVHQPSPAKTVELRFLNI